MQIIPTCRYNAIDHLRCWPWALLPYVLASIAALAIATQSMAQSTWGYKLGELKSNQQVNLCAEKESVTRLAKIFKHEGVRPGYVALAQMNGCNVGVASFTPVKIVRQVVIESDDAPEYAVSFVKVRTVQGDVQYLVTTRQVKKD